jgi:FKBP-type peptidyl-prolyl cis-trans isomerase
VDQKLIIKAAALVTSLGMGLSLLTACEKPVKLDDDLQKGSYAVGQTIGGNIKSQPLKLDLTALVGGLKDAVDGKPSKLTPEQIKDAMMKLQQQAMGKMSESAEKNKKEGDTYLEANKKKDAWKSTASGLQYKVDKEGAGASPKDGDMVKVHYTGTFINGEKFDSSRDKGEPIEFPVNGVIPGWTEALKMMKPGARYQLVIPSDLAYGPQGKGQIAPNSTLLFDVELLEVKAAPAQEAPKAEPAKKAKKK